MKARLTRPLTHEVESWQELLAGNLALRNPAMDEGQLNGAVQQIIGRLVFLHMAGERGVRRFGRLPGLLEENGLYRRLCQRFEPLAAPPAGGLQLDDEPLRQIIGRLVSRDRTQVLTIETLGQVHEQLQGITVRLAAGRRVLIERQNGTRKAAGIYYTPAAIVNHVVGQTVGKLLEERRPRQVARLRILDPACGAGAFLTAAYGLLLDWHRERYVAAGRSSQSGRIFRDSEGAIHLTVAEKLRILRAHLFGVDIGRQAVEIARLSLLLQALEGEDREATMAPDSHERTGTRLDLDGNIMCGNALVGPDFFDRHPACLLDPDERCRIKAFDWRAAFPAVLGGRAGGFDALIGNPPWGQKAVTDGPRIKRYVQAAYPSSVGIYDLFRPFVERGVQLTAPGGMFGMVLPDVVLLKDYAPTRRFVLDNLALEAIEWWGMAFEPAVIDAATLVGSRRKAPAGHLVRVQVHDRCRPLRHQIPQAEFLANPRCGFNLYLTSERRAELEQLAALPRLGEFFEVHEGVHSGNMRSELFVDAAIDSSCRPLLFGRDEIAPFRLTWRGKHIRLGAAVQRNAGGRYANLGRPHWYTRPKLLVRRTGDRVLAAADRQQRYASNNFFIVFARQRCALDLDGLCAWLNSRVMTWYFRAIEPRQGRAFAELKIKHLRVFPLPAQATENQRFQDQRCRKLNQLGAARARWSERLSLAESGQQAGPKRRCAALDEEIEATVRELLGLREGAGID